MSQATGEQTREYRMLKAHRAAKGHTQHDMMHLLGLKSITTYNKKENGEVEFTLGQAKKLADYFEVTIDQLFFGDQVHIKRTCSLS